MMHEEMSPQAGPAQLRSGHFQGLAHETSGTASVYQLDGGRRLLRLEDLRTSKERAETALEELRETQMSLIDAGEPITIVGGLHVGCYELFAHGDIRSIRDLKGKTVGVQHLGSSPHLLVSSMASYVGLDPVKEIHWVVSSSGNPMELFANGKIDAFLGFPPEPQELHARKIGHVIVNTGIDPRGPSISAACWRATGTSSANIRWRPSASCARS